MNFEARNLSHKLENGDFLFQNICINVKGINEFPKPVVVIQGPSGTGKTTLLKKLACLLADEDGGHLTLNGRTPAEYSIPVWRTKVLYVPQRIPLLNGCPKELVKKIAKFRNVDLTYDDFQQRAVLIAKRWNIEESRWDSPWYQLSGGEIQRITLAIAFARQPRLLLLDEPTSALDKETAQKVEEEIKKFACIMITHDHEQANRVATQKMFLQRVPCDLSDEE